MMKKQKKYTVEKFRAVVIGIVLLVSVGFVLPIETSATHCPGTGYDEVNGVCIPNTTGLSTTPVDTILKGVMNWLLAVLGFIAVIGFVISGIQYLTAAGDERTIETAKTNMKYSIIGIIVALSGFIVIQAIDSLLNGSTVF